MAHLAGRYQVHVLELAGFAGAPAVSGPLMPQLRDALARYLTEQKLQGAVLVGMLFGATVAYWVAATEPGLVGGVVAIDAPLRRRRSVAPVHQRAGGPSVDRRVP